MASVDFIVGLIIPNIFSNLHCDKNKDLFSEYENLDSSNDRYLFTSFARVRTPECVGVKMEGNVLYCRAKIAFHSMSSAIGRWNHNCNRRYQFSGTSKYQNTQSGASTSTSWTCSRCVPSTRHSEKQRS